MSKIPPHGFYFSLQLLQIVNNKRFDNRHLNTPKKASDFRLQASGKTKNKSYIFLNLSLLHIF